jgi:hypothetical protein
MSYSIQEAKLEFEHELSQAIQHQDIDKLRSLIQELDDEDAAPYYYMIRKWEQEDYDLTWSSNDRM